MVSKSIPELQNLEQWACDTLACSSEDSQSAKRAFLDRVVEDHGVFDEASWLAYRVLNAAQENRVIAAQDDSAYANVVHSQISSLKKSFFELAPADRNAKLKALNLIASEDALLTERLQPLSRLAHIDLHASKIPSQVMPIAIRMCNTLLLSAKESRQEWSNLLDEAFKKPEFASTASDIARKIPELQSHFPTQFQLLTQRETFMNQLNKQELKQALTKGLMKTVRSKLAWINNSSLPVTVIIFIIVFGGLIQFANSTKRRSESFESQSYVEVVDPATGQRTMVYDPTGTLRQNQRNTSTATPSSSKQKEPYDAQFMVDILRKRMNEAASKSAEALDEELRKYSAVIPEQQMEQIRKEGERIREAQRNSLRQRLTPDE